jgi:hypothetical protein
LSSTDQGGGKRRSAILWQFIHGRWPEGFAVCVSQAAGGGFMVLARLVRASWGGRSSSSALRPVQHLLWQQSKDQRTHDFAQGSIPLTRRIEDMSRLPALSSWLVCSTRCIYMDGENLTQECRSFMITRSGRGTSQQVQQAARCYGYVTGVFDTLAELEGRVVVPFCIPEGTNANALTEIVATFLDKNPARRNHSGADLVSEAWSESFPCTSR